MEITNIFSFLCGSLAATMVFAVIMWRQDKLEEDVIRHIHSKAYNRGWKDGRNAQFNEQ
jgi:hypothetical protein